MYIYFVESEKKSAETITIKPGVFADFDKEGNLIGIEIIDAKKPWAKKLNSNYPNFLLHKITVSTEHTEYTEKT